MLPTTKTPRKTNLTDLTCFLYGGFKVGKTTFCSQIEKALFLPTEPGLKFVEVIQEPIVDWQHFKKVRKELQDGAVSNYSAIIIDTIDQLYKMAMDAFCEGYNIKYPTDMDQGKGWGKGWGILNNGFVSEVMKFSRLGIGLWIVGHQSDTEIHLPTQVVKRRVPKLSQSIRETLLGQCDLILFADVKITQKEKGTPPGREHILRTEPSPYWEAGGRIKGLPPEIPLDYETFIAAYNKIQEQK